MTHDNTPTRPAYVSVTDFQPSYSPWRGGGWYVSNVRYPSGAIGCVSRNYPDKKWRIVCDHRPGAYERHAYASRDEAARAEYALTLDAMYPAGKVTTVLEMAGFVQVVADMQPEDFDEFHSDGIEGKVRDLINQARALMGEPPLPG